MFFYYILLIQRLKLFKYMHFIIRISVACQFLLCLSESNWSMICCGFIEIHFHSVKLNVVASACIKVMKVWSNTFGDLYIQNLDINYRTHDYNQRASVSSCKAAIDVSQKQYRPKQLKKQNVMTFSLFSLNFK